MYDVIHTCAEIGKKIWKVRKEVGNTITVIDSIIILSTLHVHRLLFYTVIYLSKILAILILVTTNCLGLMKSHMHFICCYKYYLRRQALPRSCMCTRSMVHVHTFLYQTDNTESKMIFSIGVFPCRCNLTSEQ